MAGKETPRERVGQFLGLREKTSQDKTSFFTGKNFNVTKGQMDKK